jgi:putative transcriptional regulator
MMVRLEPVVDDNDGFESLMQRIESSEPAPAVQASNITGKAAVSATGIPRVVEKLAGGSLHNLSWVKLGNSLRIAPVDIGCKSRQTAIYDIKAGRPMPEHEHRGEEITVLLKGSFSDAEGKYVKGDFVVRYAGERHQPTATLDTDCICLVSLEQPVKARSLWYRLMEPFVQYRLSGFSR